MQQPDSALLKAYARERGEREFAELVDRHLGLVYSTALRRVGNDVHAARDVAQSVFSDLAVKAGTIADHRTISGWLHRSTVYAAAKLVRSEQRRRKREQEAHAMMELEQNDPERSATTEITPVLDEALAKLRERDRTVLILRFLEQHDYRSIAATLQVSESGARMRVERALTRLRTEFSRRGISSTAAAIATTLSIHASATPPGGLAAAVTASALSQTLASGTLATLLNMAAATKTQFVTAAAAIALGTTIVGTQVHERTMVITEGKTIASMAPPISTDAEVEALDAERITLQSRVSDLSQALVHFDSVVTHSRIPPDKTLPLRELDVFPKPRKRVAPTYPPELKNSGIPGRVVLEMVVTQDGRVASAEPVDSTHPAFTQAAINAIREWIFEPGQARGESVNTRIRIPIEFAVNQPEWF